MRVINESWNHPEGKYRRISQLIDTHGIIKYTWDYVSKAVWHHFSLSVNHFLAVCSISVAANANTLLSEYSMAAEFRKSDMTERCALDLKKPIVSKSQSLKTCEKRLTECFAFYSHLEISTLIPYARVVIIAPMLSLTWYRAWCFTWACLLAWHLILSLRSYSLHVSMRWKTWNFSLPT